MKQTKSILMALLMLMGMMTTSCLDSENGPQIYSGYLKTVNFMGYSYFQDLNGNKYTPTSTSLADMKVDMGFDINNAGFVFVQYQLAETQGAKTRENNWDTSGGAQSFDVTLKYAVALDGPEPKIVNTVEEMETMVPETAPIALFGPQNANLGAAFYYNEEYLYLPVIYMAEKSETLKAHTINLVWVTDGVTSGTDEMVLYLRHDRTTDDKPSNAALSYGAYDVRVLMSRFQTITGTMPKTIKVLTHETGEYNANFEMPDSYTTYTVEADRTTGKIQPFTLFQRKM